MQCAVGSIEVSPIVARAAAVARFVRIFLENVDRWKSAGPSLANAKLGAYIGAGDDCVVIVRDDRDLMVGDWAYETMRAMRANPHARIVLTATMQHGQTVSTMITSHTP